MIEIAATNQEQTVGTNSVSQNTGQIDALTQRNTSLVEELATSTLTVDKDVLSLAVMIAFFEIEQA